MFDEKFHNKYKESL